MAHLTASVDLHARMIEELSTRQDQAGASMDLHARMIEELSTRLGGAQASMDLHARMIQELSTRQDQGRAQASIDLHARMIEELSTRLTSTNSKVELIDSEMIARPYLSEPGNAQSGRMLSFDSTRSPRGGYDAFEDLFRGNESFIADRLRSYVPMVKDLGPVVDIGCGRGEFLSLLEAAGVDAYGIDLDAAMLARARQHGLDVRSGDGIAHLQGLEAESLGAVVSFQVIEHMPVDEARTLMTEALRVLRPGGLFIAETVNPHSPAALKTFWLDLTHVRPLYPESLLLAASELGFASGSIYFPLGTEDQEANLRHCGEYAVLARKKSGRAAA